MSSYSNKVVKFFFDSASQHDLRVLTLNTGQGMNTGLISENVEERARMTYRL